MCTEVGGVPLVLHEDLHLVGGSEGGRGTTAHSEHGVYVTPNVDVSLPDQIPSAIALWNCMEYRNFTLMKMSFYNTSLLHIHTGIINSVHSYQKRVQT